MTEPQQHEIWVDPSFPTGIQEIFRRLQIHAAIFDGADLEDIWAVDPPEPVEESDS